MGKRKKARVSVDEDSSGEEHVQQPGGNDDGEGSSAGKSLYEILGVERTASKQEIKKAYHKLALRLHPDKNPDDEEAKENFQQLQKVISILGDEEKRALYDETGFVDDDGLAGEAASNLHDYFRTVYKRVTLADIEEFEANYRGSDVEKNDLYKLYNECKGDMNKLFCKMLCSDTMLDSHRFKDMIDEAIASGDLEETKAYKKWGKKVSKIKPPTSPLRRREKSKKSDNDLYAIISQRRNERKDRFDSMFSSMISKYGGAENSGGSEPTEEEFEAAQKKMDKKSLKVAVGAAKGLAFLHSAEVKVIYRDFKTSNVLLDSDYNAKLSDFGLAKDGPAGDKSHVSTRVMGTYGYAAPEYLATGHLTSKSDVYSYGVVLLEMLSGRRAVDKNRPSGEHNLVEWARPYLTNKRKIFRILDTRLEGQYNLDAAHRVATLAFHCLSAETKLRPTMAEVVKELEKLQDYKGTGNVQGRSKDGTRFRRKSTGDALPGRVNSVVAYPRPSASPLYA